MLRLHTACRLPALASRNPARMCMRAQELDWQSVWRHAIADCQVAVVLRLALDDSRANVIAAAADTLAALVAPQELGPALACPAPTGMLPRMGTLSPSMTSRALLQTARGSS